VPSSAGDPVDSGDPLAALLLRMMGRALDRPGDYLWLAITVDDVPVGEIMLYWHDSAWREGEIRVALHPSYRQTDLALEVAPEVLRIGFDEAGLHRIIGYADPSDAEAERLFCHIGLRQEARLREAIFADGAWKDSLVFAILDHELVRPPLDQRAEVAQV